MGPKIEKIQDLHPGLRFSSENENFKRATHQGLLSVGNSKSESLVWGRQKGVTPICSDFLRFVPIWAACFGNTPICSDLLRFPPVCSVLFSEQI